MLGGKINFTSQEGVGSTFFVSIPLNYANENETKKEIVPEIKVTTNLGKEEVILVAEDDNINFLLIENILKSYNFKIIRAKDGVEAVEFCKTNQEIDLVLMDIKMPNLDGYEAFTEIRKINPTIPIIAQTSYSFEEELDKIKKLGFNNFISKPIQKQKLLELIKVYLNR